MKQSPSPKSRSSKKPSALVKRCLERDQRQRQTVTLTVTLSELRGESSGSVSHEVVDSSGEGVELAKGIEPSTCGLQNRCSAN